MFLPANEISSAYFGKVGAVGKPARGSNVPEHFINDLKEMLVYESDPGEQAYYDTRNMVYDWLEKHGAEKGFGEPTDRSNALYYYRQALKFGDMNRVAAKYLEKYYELGGTPKGLKQSILRVHPLAALSKQERPIFYRQLTLDQKGVLKRAETWYLYMFVRSRHRKAA